MPVQSTVSAVPYWSMFQVLWVMLPHELQVEVLMYLSLQDLLIIQDTHPYGALTRVVLYCRLNALLSVWRLPHEETVEMMDKTNTIMSGSAGLYMTSPTRWWPRDLDFYCPYEQYETVLQYFLSQHYQIQNPIEPPATDDDLVYKSDSTQCLEYVATLVLPSKHLKINLIQSSCSSSCAPVMFFHSTIVMNIVCSTGVVCLYPELTFKDEGVVNHCKPLITSTFNQHPHPEVVEEDVRALTKYRDRGYTLHEHCRDIHSPQETSCGICEGPFRTYDDGQSMSMAFQPVNHVLLFPYVQWKLGIIKPPKQTSPFKKVVEQFSTQVVVEGEPVDSQYHLLKRRKRYAIELPVSEPLYPFRDTVFARM